MLKVGKFVLAGALAFTGLAGASFINTPSAQAAEDPPASVYLSKGEIGVNSNRIIGKGQYGRFIMEVGTKQVTGATATVMKETGWFDEEVATLDRTIDDWYRGNYGATTNVWLDKGAEYYIKFSVPDYNGSGSARLYNYNFPFNI
ncbi:hypothetical protein [Bacillus sp. Brlt_9]|uniref:hypothetical protein n=1 Tax=Bacillus sp. Brlt_9 TaxID=3110916 RepID=UPI003F7B5FCE